MDALSLILDDIRLTGVEYRFVQVGSPWAFRFATGGQAAFHLLMAGTATVQLRGQAPLQLAAGDMVFLPGGLEHEVYDQPPGDSQAPPDLGREIRGHQQQPIQLVGDRVDAMLLSGRCGFDVDLARPLVSALPPSIVLRGLGERPPEWMRIGLEFLALEGATERPGRQAIINRLIDILMIEFLRDYVERLPAGSASWLLALRDPALSAALSAIHRQPAAPWTVPALAREACLSRSAFAERFSQVVGQPPLSYLAAHRMRLAAWQLSHSQQPICRIAEAVGYASETAFSQAFKRLHGQSPSRFRQAASTTPAG